MSYKPTAEDEINFFTTCQYTIRAWKDEWVEKHPKTFREKERESSHLKHFFIGNRLEVVINSNYHCSEPSCGRQQRVIMVIQD